MRFEEPDANASHIEGYRTAFEPCCLLANLYTITLNP